MKNDRALWRAVWLWSLTAVSVLSVVVTLFQDELYTSTGGIRLALDGLRIQRLALGGEHSLGVWWQGFLLLLASLHSLDGYFLNRDRDATAARAWLVLGVVFACLSLDEVGSLHERSELFVPVGGFWTAVFPFAAVLTGAVAYAIAVLLRSSTYRVSGVMIAGVLSLFGVVAFQEHLEWTTHWWGDSRNFRTALEEGTEMAAMLLAVAASLPNTKGVFGRGGAGQEPVFLVLDRGFRPVFWVGIACVPVLTILTMHLPDINHRGHPASWLAAAAFAAAGLSAVRPFLRTGNLESTSLAAVVLSIVCLMLSMIAVDYHGANDPSKKLEFLLVGCLAIAATWLLGVPADSRGKAALIAVPLVTLSALSVAMPSPWLCFAAFAAAGLVVFAGNRLLTDSLAGVDRRAACPAARHDDNDSRTTSRSLIGNGL